MRCGARDAVIPPCLFMCNSRSWADSRHEVRPHSCGECFVKAATKLGHHNLSRALRQAVVVRRSTQQYVSALNIWNFIQLPPSIWLRHTHSRQGAKHAQTIYLRNIGLHGTKPSIFSNNWRSWISWVIFICRFEASQYSQTRTCLRLWRQRPGCSRL